MTMQERAQQLLRALQRATSEHGAPNSFSFGELHVFDQGPPPMIAGRAFPLIASRLVEGHALTVRKGRVYVGDASARPASPETFSLASLVKR